MDSRLKISGMTDDADFLNASITPCLSPLNGSIAPFSSPRQSLSRGLNYLKTWIPA